MEANRKQDSLWDGREARPRVVIVGGGFGGSAAVRQLRKAAAVEVALLDRRNHFTFQPLLYQVATATLSPANISSPLRRIFQSSPNVSVYMAEVLDIDLRKQLIRIEGTEHTYSYDYLVLAAGAVPTYFGHNEWEKSAPGLKSIKDSLDIRSRFLLAFEQAELESDMRSREAALTFVVVGGGPTGVELAGSIAEAARTVLRRSFRLSDPSTSRVILIESSERILKAFHPSLSESAQRYLEELGVEVLLNTAVVDVEPDGVSVRGGSAVSHVSANNIIWAAGVRPSPLAAMLDVELGPGGRVIVDENLSIPGFSNAFAIGDISYVRSHGEGFAPGVAPAAIQMGHYVGKLIRRELDGETRSSAKPFRYVDKGSLATVGKRKAVAQFGGLRLGGTIAWLAWAVVHILYLTTFRNRLITSIEWIWSYLLGERGVRLITDERLRPKPSLAWPDRRLEGLAPEKTRLERYPPA